MINRAQLKERENLTRFRTHYILAHGPGEYPSEEMILAAKRACVSFYEEHPDKLDVPSSVLKGVWLHKEEEVSSGGRLEGNKEELAGAGAF